MAILACGPMAVCPRAGAISITAGQDETRVTEGAVAEPSLPPHGLLRIGTNGLRMGFFVTDIAFSPDGKLIAAAEANSGVPNVELFEIRTGLMNEPPWARCGRPRGRPPVIGS